MEMGIQRYSDAAVVLINGHLCPIVGAVSMDMMSAMSVIVQGLRTAIWSHCGEKGCQLNKLLSSQSVVAMSC